MSDDSTMGDSRNDAVEGEQYEGHVIAISEGDTRRRVQIDDRSYRYGKIGDLYYLDEYAYDPTDSLDELGRRFIDYRAATATRSSGAES
jgi:hypothetical protein